MDLTIGIETRDEYLSLEVAKGAMTMVRDVLLAKPGETVLITGDTSSDKRVIDAFAQAAYAIDAIPIVINYATAPCAVMDPPAPVAAAVEKADGLRFLYLISCIPRHFRMPWQQVLVISALQVWMWRCW